jgi:hypothetical protein
MDVTIHFSQYIDSERFERDYSLSRRTFLLWIAEGKLMAYKPSKRKTLVKRAGTGQGGNAMRLLERQLQ